MLNSLKFKDIVWETLKIFNLPMTILSSFKTFKRTWLPSNSQTFKDFKDPWEPNVDNKTNILINCVTGWKVSEKSRWNGVKCVFGFTLSSKWDIISSRAGVNSLWSAWKCELKLYVINIIMSGRQRLCIYEEREISRFSRFAENLKWLEPAAAKQSSQFVLCE